jgi:hypothetical protein
MIRYLTFRYENRKFWGPVAAPPRLCSPSCASGGSRTGGSKGEYPLGRRTESEKGRQGAERPLEGGRRSASPSKEQVREPLRRATPWRPSCVAESEMPTEDDKNQIVLVSV